MNTPTHFAKNKAKFFPYPRTCCAVVRISRAALALLVLVAGFAALSPVAAASSQGAYLKPPKSVYPGQNLILRISGFPPNSVVSFTASIEGPASFSGRELGRARTNGSGAAKFRTRFPRTYQWCDADLQCSTYKWPANARIALLAQAKKPPHTSARRVVPLEKGGRRKGKGKRGPKPLTIPVTARKAIFQAVCPPGERCKAKVKIEAGKKTYARGSYSVPAGKTRKVRLELTKAGRKKLSSSKRAKAKATITDIRTGKSKSFPVVLRRRG